MAYIGKTPVIGNFQKCDSISVVNGQAAYTLQVGGVNVSPQSENHMLVSLNGILQAPVDSFTVSGSTLTFASNLVTGDVIDFVMILGNVLDLGVPSDNTVSLAKLTATGTKDATTFLRGDNTFAAAGGGITEADLWRINTSTSITAGMDITANWERCDTNFEKIGTGLTESSGVFTFPSTGKYLTCYDIQFNTTQNTNYAGIYLYLSTDGGSNFSHIVTNTNTQIYAAGGLSIGSASGCGIIDVTDASNFKFKLQVDYQNVGSGSPAIYAHTDRNRSYIHIIRLGDT